VNRLHRVGSVAILALGLVGCRYENIHATTPDGKPTPWVNLNCEEPGNDIGFSFELPSCVCDNGIRIRYVGVKQPDGSYQIYYEQERGFRSGNKADLIVMRSTTIEYPEVLIVGGRRMPPPERSSSDEKEAWRLSTENWSSILKLYGPNVMKTAFRTCEEDREGRGSAAKLAAR
jgi:hypothetical protein